MNEAETRAEHIDPALKGAGWGVVEGSRILREYPIAPGRIEGHGRRGQPLKADYVLEYRNRKLAVSEAKAFEKALTEGVAQAKDYATKLALRWAFATNGQGIYQVDMAPPPHSSHPSYSSHPPEREIPRYPMSPITSNCSTHGHFKVHHFGRCFFRSFSGGMQAVVW